MLIPFPIAFFIAAFLCDLAYWQTANASWTTAAIWLIGAGLVMAALAAVAGLIFDRTASPLMASRAIRWTAITDCVSFLFK